MNDPMASKMHDWFAEIAAGLASPRVLPAIDKAIAEVQDIQLALYDLRKTAARLHKGTAAARPQEDAAPPMGDGGALAPAKASPPQTSDRTIGALAESYKSHADSRYHNLRYQTKENYNGLIKRIVDDCGPVKLGDLKAPDIQRLYHCWAKGGISIGHSLINMLRGLVHFGAAKLADSECERLAVLLHNMRFKVERPQSEALSLDDAKKIIRTAHEQGFPSIALALAFQFDCKLQQKDVIGEWVPLSELGTPSDVIDDDKKWRHGLRWSEIDKNGILRHVTSRGGKEIKIDLKHAALVMAEFERLGELPTSGPVIVSEYNKRPYASHEFRRRWRLMVEAAGLPKNVKNMNSRLRGSASMSGTGGMTASAEIVRATDRHL